VKALPGLLPGVDVRFDPDWLAAAEADALLAALVDDVPWSQHRVRLFGREMPAPRLSAWIGDPGAAYTYSRVCHQPLPWTATLATLRERLQASTGARFNSVLANRYRDGRDSMGWHADDEAELGDRPLIASISLGAARVFQFKPRGGGRAQSITLGHGSLLLMGGDTQRLYVHALPKTARPVGERINLTFRWVESSPAPSVSG
jgi:alkylated DNA repair dioxygenase AlkB